LNFEDRIVTMSAVNHDHLITLTIKDNGSGVNETISKQVFDPFFSTKSDGMGMGLAISQSIIKNHGGTMAFSNNNDCGASFQFTIPTVEAV